MIALPRDALRMFRSVAKRCQTGRTSDPAPVQITADVSGTTLMITCGEVILAYAIPATSDSVSLTVPAAVFDTVAGNDADSIQLHPKSQRSVRVRWTEGGLPREQTFDLLPEPKHTPRALPDEWTPVPDSVRDAFHEAGRIAARESTGRYAFHRIQILRNRIVASDSRQVLIQGGFDLPVPMTGLLVPAIPVFGAKEFRSQPVQLGVTATHLVIRMGSWTVWLHRDEAGRFPNVDEVIPKSLTPSVVTISDPDAAQLHKVLPTLPGHDDENAPVTLELTRGRVTVRAQSADTGPEEFPLAGSTATGPPIRYVLDRQYLKRALTLGFRTFQFASVRKPFVALDGDRIFLAAGLQPEDATPPYVTRSPRSSGRQPAIALPSRSSLENLSMKSLNGSGSSPSERIEPAAPDELDLHAEAEALRLALVDVVQKAGRLVAALKHRRKEQKALSQVWSSLKSLKLGS